MGYTLQASSGSLNGTSATFDITVGAATQLVFNPSPSDSETGVAFPTQPVVEVQDAGGNLVTAYVGNVTLAIGTNPSGGTLAGTLVVAVSGGKATFSGLSIDNVGDGYTLQATSGALTPATSDPFDIAKLTAVITLSNLSHTYDGSQHGATATTTPAWPDGGADLHRHAPQHMARRRHRRPTPAATRLMRRSTTPDYRGSATGTLVINKATATVTLSNLTRTFNGSPRSATAVTTTPGLTTHHGSPTMARRPQPTNAGSYVVVATIVDQNYQGSATGTLYDQQGHRHGHAQQPEPYLRRQPAPGGRDHRPSLAWRSTSPTTARHGRRPTPAATRSLRRSPTRTTRAARPARW